MTLLVAILCTDGAVIASDRQTTHGGLAGVTVGHPTTKISNLGGKALLASSGHRGLGQQFAAGLTSLVDGFPRQEAATSLINVQKEFRKLIEPAFQAAQAAMPVIGAQAAQSDVICGSVFIAKFKDGIKVVEVTPIGAVEQLSPELPFLCLGSGKQNADPFLGFLWSVFMADKSPSLNEGVLLSYWTVSNAIRLATNGVGLGIDVFSMNASSGEVKQYSQEELHENDGFIKEVEGAMRGVRDVLSGVGGLSPPTMVKKA